MNQPGAPSPRVPGDDAGSSASDLDITERGVARAAQVAAAGRLAAAASSAVAATDRLARLAARLVGAPAAQVWLLADAPVAVGAVGTVGSVTARTRPSARSEQEALCAATAELGTLAVADVRVDPRVTGLLPVTGGQIGCYLGACLSDSRGIPVGALSVCGPEPRAWSADDVATVEELAASVMAELELAALSTEYTVSRTRWDSAIEAAGIGGFEWDLSTGSLVWDERVARVFDIPGTLNRASEGQIRDAIHRDDLPLLQRQIREAVTARSGFDVEFRFANRPGAPVRWARIRGRVVRGDGAGGNRLLGAVYETTARREGLAQVARLLDSMSAAFICVDRDWRLTYVNTEAERLLGHRGEELPGRLMWDVLPSAAGTDLRDRYREVLATGNPMTVEVRGPGPAEVWLELRAWSGPEGLSMSLQDVTQRRSVELRVARDTERDALLARVTTELTGTLDGKEGAERLTRLVVPALADWCLVTLVHPRAEGPDWLRLRDIAWWHPRRTLRSAVALLGSLRPKLLTDDPGITEAVMSGRPAVLASEQLAEAIAALPSGPERERLRQLAPAAGVILPMRAHGRTLGMLSLFWEGRTEAVSGIELRACLDVAGRAGLALDNARLYDRQRRLAEGLQQSLIRTPRESGDLELAVRYQAAAEAAQVGGDWYDAFVQADGSTVLVIGDVVGHDDEAAAAMSQVRGLLRGVAATTGEGPAAILTRLDQAMALLRVGVTATVIAARVAPRVAGADGVRMAWSNAGHPPPVLVGTGGVVRVLDGGPGADADLLLGLDPDVLRQEREITVAVDQTVLLYTDGLVERRGQSLDEGLALLQRSLAEVWDLGLEDLCDELLERMLPERSGDDVAVVALRLRAP